VDKYDPESAENFDLFFNKKYNLVNVVKLIYGATGTSCICLLLRKVKLVAL
jgi:hypothetical protein